MFLFTSSHRYIKYLPTATKPRETEISNFYRNYTNIPKKI